MSFDTVLQQAVMKQANQKLSRMLLRWNYVCL